jgi:putative phosphoribosyl transferase
MEPILFEDRVDAGRRLAALLERLRGPDLVVLGLPRGGVVVAAEVARALGAPLDVLVVRKLGHPTQPELATGALGEEGVRVLGPASTRHDVDEPALQAVERREAEVLRRRVARLRQAHPRVGLQGRTALVVDDGIATGSTIRAACLVARSLGAARVVVGVPVAPASAVRQLLEADDVVCVSTPARFRAVGLHYRDFDQTTEDEVLALLAEARRRP